MPDEESLEDLALKYALANAVEHGGAANPKAVIGKILAERPDLRPRAKDIGPVAARICADVNAMDAAAQEAALAEAGPLNLPQRDEREEGDLKPLPNATRGEVVMRFAPNPSGPATLGHARGMVLHWAYRERYDGKLILRFDDTDTTVKPPLMEAYEWIPEDFAWLAGVPDEIVTASDRLPIYYEHARALVERDGAYVCECEAETFRDLKNRGEACPCRGGAVAANLEKWDRFVKGEYQRGAAVLRVKTDIRHKDPALRDWVAFRIASEPHPRPEVGDRYKAWPLLDFQSAVDDHLTGVTHILRGKDLRDSTLKQGFLYEHMGWTYPEAVYWGRASVHEFGKFSKSILVEGIRRGEYTGWDDPRLPTLRALRRRGFRPEAITSFWLSFGLTEKDVAASMANLEAENRKVVEAHANRYFFVADPVPLVMTDVPDALDAAAPLHPDHPDRGARRHHLPARDGRVTVLIAAGDARHLAPGVHVRLKDLANVEVTGTGTGTGTGRYVGGDLAWLKETKAPIIHWAPEENVPARLLLPDATTVEGVAERPLAAEAVDAVVQLERVGYARVEATGDRVELVFAHK